jgi:hypothetical protein
VGTYVAKQAPDFDSRNWGYGKLVDLVAAIKLFEVKRTAGQNVRVREVPEGGPTKSGGSKAGGTKKAAPKKR